MAEGFSNRRISEALFLAEGTVKNHVSSILLKFGARDRTNAVLRALHEASYADAQLSVSTISTVQPSPETMAPIRRTRHTV